MQNLSISSQKYPPSLYLLSSRHNTRAKPRFSKYKLIVHDHYGYKHPPRLLTQEKSDALVNFYKTEKQRTGKTPYTARKAAWYPSSGEDVEYKNVITTEIVFSEDEDIYERLLRFKEITQELGRLHCDFWVANPLAVDSQNFDIKALTYALNLYHTGGLDSKGKITSSGKDKAYYFEKHAGLTQNAESVNKLYNRVLCDMARPRQSLFKITYTARGIKATYLSPFISTKDPTKVLYLSHTWQTPYISLLPQDLKNINISQEQLTKTLSLSLPLTEGLMNPVIDGWADLVTVQILKEKKLSVLQRKFINNRYGPGDRDVGVEIPHQNKDFGEWRIPDEPTLLLQSDDWRKAIPASKYLGPDVYHYLPDSHYKYQAINYPGDFEYTTIQTAPLGDLYGISTKAR